MSQRRTILDTLSWVLFALVVCALAARLATKFSTKMNRPRLGLDDLFISLAAIFSLGQTVTVFINSSNALGQHMEDLSPNQIELYQKAEYVAWILYIANIGCSRLSLCILVRRLLPGALARYTALVFTYFTAVWTIVGVVANAFICRLPTPWEFIIPENCYDIAAFVNYIGITDIVVEVLLVMIFLFIWNVRLSTQMQVFVFLVFVARLSIAGAIGTQLYFFNLHRLDDHAYTSWKTTVCQQIAQNFSIITACLPYLHPFVIRILASPTEPETIKLSYGAPPWIRQYLDRKTGNVELISSRSSKTSAVLFTEKTNEPCCRPLATYGFDLPSTYAHSQSSSRFSLNTTQAIRTAASVENFFDSLPEMSRLRQVATLSDTITLQISESPGETDAAPAQDHGSENVVIGLSKRTVPDASTTREPTVEHVFERFKVTSLPEGIHSRDDGDKHSTLPSPTPMKPSKLRRSF